MLFSVRQAPNVTLITSRQHKTAGDSLLRRFGLKFRSDTPDPIVRHTYWRFIASFQPDGHQIKCWWRTNSLGRPTASGSDDSSTKSASNRPQILTYRRFMPFFEPEGHQMWWWLFANDWTPSTTSNFDDSSTESVSDRQQIWIYRRFAPFFEPEGHRMWCVDCSDSWASATASGFDDFSTESVSDRRLMATKCYVICFVHKKGGNISEKCPKGTKKANMFFLNI